MVKARFITFEGGEGAGKSTQIKRLQEHLSTLGIDAIITREPGGCPEAERIRDILLKGEGTPWDPLSEYLLFSASRREHIIRTIRPALAAGQWVLCDRFVDSSYAYQGYGHGLDLREMQKLYHWLSGETQPDLTIYFDLDPQVGLARTQGRTHEEDRMEGLSLSFHERVKAGYQGLLKDNPQRMVAINADQAPEQVFADILKVMERVL